MSQHSIGRETPHSLASSILDSTLHNSVSTFHRQREE
jgi:hypothetical protein